MTERKTTDTANPILIVVDAEHSGPSMHRALSKLLSNGSAASELHLMAFIGDSSDALLSSLKLLWPGPVKSVQPATYFPQATKICQEKLSALVGAARGHLRTAALKAAGEKWAARFDHLWWYTAISAKHTAGNPAWWHIFRLEAVRQALQTANYGAVIFVGSQELAGLVRGLCQAEKRFFTGQIITRPSRSWLIRNFLVARFLSGIRLAFTALKAHRLRYDPHRQVSEQVSKEKALLAYTWFPRAWTVRAGVWEDMYYGRMLNLVQEQSEIRPIYVLRISDNLNPPPIPVIAKRFRTLQGSPPPLPWVVLEMFDSWQEVIKTYVNFWDLFNLWRTSRSPTYKKAFLLDNIDLRPILSPLLWRSVTVRWPYLESLERQAKRAATKLKPQLTVVYSFEHLWGRAILRGTQTGFKGGSTLGLQHGPITPAKMVFSGAPQELETTPWGGTPLPQPDFYSVDGEEPQQLLIERGVSPRSIFITGPARFDPIWPHAKVAAQSDRFQNPPIKVLVAPSLHDSEFVIRFVISALARDTRLHIIFKPHPKLPFSAFQTLVETYWPKDEEPLARFSLVQDGEIYKWMEAADLFVCTYSSTGIEAIVFGLPVIILETNRTPDMSLFAFQPDSVLRALTPKELRNYIDLLLKDDVFRQNYCQNLNKVVQYSFGQIDANATKRLTHLLADLMGQTQDLSARGK